MQGPFWQHVEDLFSKLRGRTLIAAIAVWAILMAVALSCVFGLIKLPSVGNRAPSPDLTPIVEQSAPTATATLAPDQGEFVTLPTPTPTPAAAATAVSTLAALPWGDFGYGIATHIYEPEVTMNVVKNQLGLTWVKQQIRWDIFSTEPGKMDWSGYDPVVEAAAAQGVKLMLSVVGAPAWSRSYVDANPEAAPPDDLTLFAQFLGELVDRYPGKVHAIEVWNEQNLDREWDTAEGVNALRYVEMLRLAYQTIKARDPNIIVISGAL